MTKFWSRLDLRIKMLIPMVLTITAMLTIIAIAIQSGEKTRIGGPIDNKIQDGKDLVADILPPPMYVLELHLAASQAAASTDPKRQDTFKKYYAQFTKEYQERQAYWAKSTLEPNIREVVSGSLNQSVQAYFKACDDVFIPALAAKDTATPLKLYNTVMAEKYAAQRDSVDRVVTLVKNANDSSYQMATQIGDSNFRFSVIGQVVSAVVGIGLTCVVMFAAIKQIKELIAKGVDYQRQIDSISREQIVIEFDMNGRVLCANDNMLRSMGYQSSEVIGQHHSMFVSSAISSTAAYNDLWTSLRRGECVSGEVLRKDKHGNEVWLSASYNPIPNDKGILYKVVKFATNITQAKQLQKQVTEATERERQQAAVLQEKVSVILQTVDRISAGDLTATVPDLGNDDVGNVATALNKAISSVRTTMEGVAEVSTHLADASSQLAAACEEISSGAQEQASSLEETASTLEEITATVKQNSDSSQQARQLASNSRDVAEKGGQVVSNAIEAMEAINHSSKKIAEIISTIDEIAFQTNLLALNAAVEAARAGEQGRGFAVVASEVRNLAQRSAGAAKEIQALIQDSVKKVDVGSELVTRSGNTLHDIVTSVKRVTDIVSEIAAASSEQSAGIEQVNKAVTQMDGVTQQNASQTEEMSATAQNLSDQAKQLRDLLSSFRLHDHDHAATAKQAFKPAVKEKSKNGVSKHHSKPRPAVAKAMKQTRSRPAVHELDLLAEADSEIDGYTEF